MALGRPDTESKVHPEHAQHEHVSSEVNEDTIRNPKGWFNFRLSGYCRFKRLIIHSSWYLLMMETLVIIIGLSMGLYGYDNNFAAPLVQLPLFIEKYQGPGLTFTVRSIFPQLVYRKLSCLYR
jgi:hypothetical protein